MTAIERCVGCGSTGGLFCPEGRCMECHRFCVQPQAEAVCVACGHPGADHISLGYQRPHCRCGCTEWEMIAGPIGLIITS